MTHLTDEEQCRMMALGALRDWRPTHPHDVSARTVRRSIRKKECDLDATYGAHR